MFRRHNSPGLLIRASLSLSLLAAPLWLSCSRSALDEEISEAAKNYRPPEAPRPPLDSRINDYDIKLLDVGNVRMPGLVGNGKVVVVNLWATWCGPCRREIPELVALQERFKDKGVEVVGLSVEEPEQESLVRNFASRHSINYKIGFSPGGVFYLLSRAHDGRPRASVPQSFIFDKNGKLIDSVVGYRPNFRAWAEGAVSYALKSS